MKLKELGMCKVLIDSFSNKQDMGDVIIFCM